MVLRGIFRRVAHRAPKGYIIVDFRDDYIQLPDGTLIPRNKILHVDTQRKVIVYLDDLGRVREASYASSQAQQVKPGLEAVFA